MEGGISIERQESENTAQYLKRLKDMGFIFHGSSNPNIEELEPRYAFDPDTSRNTDKAVFGTDNPTWSAIFGIFGGKGIPWATSVENGEVVAKIPESNKGEVMNGTGMVYVLPREPFRENDAAGQFKSHEAVKPVLMVQIKYADYLELGGKVEWT